MQKIAFLILVILFLFSNVVKADEGLSLREIYVITDVVTPGEITSGESVSSSKINQQFKQDTSSLLEYFTGIDNAANGSVSSIPYMHGLNDDRIRISVDGVDLNSACTSHTDTDLSFIDINDVDYIKVFAGITPVSMGGDSIAGSIKIKTKNPTFSQDDQLIYSTKLKSFYKSNNDEQGVHFKSSVASSNAYLKYSGSYSQSNNYSSANDFKGANYGGTSDKSGIRDDEIASSGYRMENHQLSYGYQINNHLLEIKFDYQSIPYQGFMNQRMDVVGQHFRPEFINRVDDIVVFHPLGKEQIKSIAKIQLASLRARLAEKGYKLSLSAAAMDKLADAGFDPVFGARPLKRAIQVQVENPLAHQLLAGELIPESTVRIDADDSGLFIVSN